MHIETYTRRLTGHIPNRPDSCGEDRIVAGNLGGRFELCHGKTTD